MFATAILSIVPAVNFSGLFAPVSSLSGGAKIIGLTFPSAWYQPITVGVFAKALGMAAIQLRGGRHRRQRPRSPAEEPDAVVTDVPELEAAILALLNGPPAG